MAPTVTLAQSAILTAMDFRSGRDTIVMTALDFPSVRYAFEQLAAEARRARRRGAERGRRQHRAGPAARGDRRTHCAGRGLACAFPLGLHHRRRGALRARARHGRGGLARRVPLRGRDPGGREGERRGLPHRRRAQVALRRTRRLLRVRVAHGE